MQKIQYNVATENRVQLGVQLLFFHFWIYVWDLSAMCTEI